MERRISEVMRDLSACKRRYADTRAEINELKAFQNNDKRLDGLYKKKREVHKTLTHHRTVLMALYLQVRRRDSQRVSIPQIVRRYGLTLKRIEKFHHFQADKSLNDEKCICCMDELQVGRVMVRLDCEHLLCKICTDKWFADNKTCPTCRRSFV